VILVLRALGLGDVLTAVPALRALRDPHPAERIVLAAPAAFAGLITLSGAVDEVRDVGTPDRAVPDGLPAELHGARLAVNLHGRGPQSTALLGATGPGEVIAFGNGGAAWREGEHEVARWCRLLAEHGIPADPSRLGLPAPDGPVPAGAPGATLLHPGAASPARRWPAARWRAVAEGERARGRRVLVTAGPGEEDLARTVGREVIAPADVLALAALVAAAGRVVCGDTGVAHLATALGTPSVVLFGPVSPAEWGPPPGRGHVALWAGRRGDPHAGRPDPGLLAIGVDEVLAALDGLGRSAAAAA
jgi:ADP-heptose:LPS heptosyltransferase